MNTEIQKLKELLVAAQWNVEFARQSTGLLGNTWRIDAAKQTRADVQMRLDKAIRREMDSLTADPKTLSAQEPKP